MSRKQTAQLQPALIQAHDMSAVLELFPLLSLKLVQLPNQLPILGLAGADIALKAFSLQTEGITPNLVDRCLMTAESISPAYHAHWQRIVCQLSDIMPALSTNLVQPLINTVYQQERLTPPSEWNQSRTAKLLEYALFWGLDAVLALPLQEMAKTHHITAAQFYQALLENDIRGLETLATEGYVRVCMENCVSRTS